MDRKKIFLSAVLGWFFYFISFCVRKNKKIWVFGAWHGQKYADNSKFLFEYCNSLNDDNTYVWITSNSKILNDLNNNDYLVFHERSLKGIYYQLISGTVFITHSVHADLFGPCINGGTKIVQLWHGLALKKIMFDTPKLVSNKKRMIDFVFPFLNHRYDYVVSSSEETSDIFQSAFRIEKSNIICSGLPRNDAFFKVNSGNSDSNEEKYKIIYMPTLRNKNGISVDLFEGFGFDVKKYDDIFGRENIELYIRMHPMNTPPRKIVSSINNATNIHISHEDDIYDSISNYSCLITDFSSIYLDFILTDKPIIFAPFNFEEYIEEERNLYYDYDEVTYAPYCYDWNQVVDRVIEVKNTSHITENMQLLRRKFHLYKDGYSSSRLHKKISDILEEL
ncbi:hypothetical protein BCS96_10265 [Vibrio breoganii]|uniref:CDP-glycerol glycerophosphotransferase family protein n=1 Tax=Vibrio breoganii TaxID=553239 RepID=UPI000CC1AF5E|nr:CDP-glycerol glycerophosphotransferase family protein [Vibrio breoganii]PMO99175.1 hypothetical protein BCS96_10265 [Vibrio breoganii]